MSRLCRAEVIDPHEVNVVHVINRTVRSCFLFGDDPLSGKNFDHRKDWIEELLQHFAACFGIDLLCYSILSNHYHLILRTRPDVVDTWDDTEVARRWLMICPPRKIANKPAQPTEAELNFIRRCPVRVSEIRQRLSSVSWWMRLLNQRVAQRANKEENEKGRFWQDRYRAIRLIDEESLVACAAYVELNPIRAAIAQTLEESEYTSIKRRIDACRSVARGEAGSSSNLDEALSRVELNEADGPIGPRPSGSGRRCSEKGFLPMTTGQYLELLDWTARQAVAGKRGSTPQDTPPVLNRLGLEASRWRELAWNFEETFGHVAGRYDRASVLRSHLTGRRFPMRPSARSLLPSPD